MTKNKVFDNTSSIRVWRTKGCAYDLKKTHNTHSEVQRWEYHLLLKENMNGVMHGDI